MVATAVNKRLSPFAKVTLVGLTLIDAIVADVTVSVVVADDCNVLPGSPTNVAVIVTGPAAMQVATPVLALIEALELSEDDHVNDSEISADDPSAKLATALKPLVRPTPQEGFMGFITNEEITEL
jgi:hypothetical protein